MDGAIAAARMTDTVKEAAPDGRVLRTLDRAHAVGDPDAAGVPRRRAAAGARRERVRARRRHRRRRRWSRTLGGTVRVVEAPTENIKVTAEHDLRIAEALLG